MTLRRRSAPARRPRSGPLALACAALLALPAALAAQTQLVWNQQPDGYAALESHVVGTPAQDVESADDFDLVGSVSRVLVAGTNCTGCNGPEVTGVWVRFYTWDAGEPGALEHEVFLADGDPGLVFDSNDPTTFDITLPAPFVSDGKHFVSFQLVTPESHVWRWWSSGGGTPSGTGLHQRDKLHGGDWLDNTEDASVPFRDLAFQLRGEGPPPPGEPELLWTQHTTLFAGATVSGVWPGTNLEAADDFDVLGDITRFHFRGDVPFQAVDPQVQGVRVRFYSWQAGEPGVVLYDETLPVGPQLIDEGADLWLVKLPVPFEAEGRHFLSVQLLASNVNDWGWAQANEGAPVEAPAVMRGAGGDWMPIDDNGQQVDLAFHLTGIDKTPPVPFGEDPCGPWQAVPVDLPADIDFMVGRDLDVIASDDVWMVGTYSLESGDGSTFSMHFDGSEWSLVPTPSPEPYPGAGGASLDAVAAVSSDLVWAAGTQTLPDPGGFVGAQPFVIRWDGTRWTEIPAPITEAGAGVGLVRGIEVIAEDDIWFVGEWGVAAGCDYALAMHWDGSDFTVIPTPCSGIGCDTNGYGLEAAAAVSANDVWAVGGGGGLDPSICSYVIHWDGNAWSYVPSPEPGIHRRLNDVVALAADDVWATGTYFDVVGGYQPYAIHWDGNGFELFDGADFPDGGGALHAFAPDDIYAAGGAIAHWDGTGWTPVDDLGQLTGENLGVSLTALDGAAPCELWTGGREVVAGEILGFSARQVTDKFWAQLAVPSCDGSAPADSLAPLSPPVLGGTASVAVDDPTGATGLPSGFSWWLLGLVPAADAECGDLLPRFGIGDAPGRLLLDVTHPTAVFHGPLPWGGPGSPSIHALGVPSDPALAGLRVHTQGLLKGFGDAVLTEGLELQLGQ